MTGFKLPERLYYPLDEAAKVLECPISNIFHYGAIGALDISLYVSLAVNANGFQIDFEPLEVDADQVNNGSFREVVSGSWSVSHIEYKYFKDNDLHEEGFVAKTFNGFFYVCRSSIIDLEFNRKDGVIKPHSLNTHKESEQERGIHISLFGGLGFDLDYLCVRKKDLDNLKCVGNMPMADDTAKTISKKAEIIPAILKMVPEIADMDLERTPVSKIVYLIETVAVSKGIELPPTHRQTWQKYLGRG
ncbi:hypothetical protein [Serratia liquefaciens]|uniref:hypothetical protein n=1 Tax=Serratia liquefaciens TaxID=614 RepID=UPI0021771D0F|nr:hypothetical protein [Serratia liquefaciens]CAI1775728.1 Uncharacterised protein [Serratia liquefaciens]